MNCLLIDKQTGMYFRSFRVHTGMSDMASIVNISRAFKINQMTNNRYGLLLPIIAINDNSLLPFGYLTFSDYMLTKMYSEEIN